MKKTKKGIITALIILLALSFPLITMETVIGARLYRDTGALPWRIPETKLILGSSELYTDEEIRAAAECILEAYKSEYYSYNGFYLIELEYDESLYRPDESDELLFRATVYHGDHLQSMVRTDSTGHFTVIPSGNGWVCKGWGHA